MVLARPVGAFGLAFEILAQDRGGVVHRLEGIDDNGQVLIFDLDQFDAIGGGVAVFRHHESHFLVLEQDLLVRQHGLNVAGERRHVVQVEGFQVLCGDHGEHAGCGKGRVLVDLFDAGVAVGRAHKIAEQHAGQLDVVDIVALSLREARVLDAFAR